MKIKQWILILTLVMALGLAACTRSASESPTQVPDAGATQAGTDQQPPSNMETAVAGGGFATQTAQAAVTTPGTGEQTPGETPVPTSEVPGTGELPTAAPGDVQPTEPASGELPTAAPPAPTEAPTTAVGGSCTSPYTVQAGEWIWSIGRKCNISPQVLIDANDLACYYDLSGTLQCPVYAGDVLVWPANPAPFTGP